MLIKTWDELERACLSCQKCALADTRHNVVFGVGPRDAEVMCIGEGPGENEDLQGEPFVGRGGKLLDIKCRAAGFAPDAVVIVATVKALKYNGGVPKAQLGEENLEALERGIPNLLKHVENITRVFGLPAVVAINRFANDTDAELDLIRSKCRELGVNVALSEVWAKGGAGGEELAREVLRLTEQPGHFQYAYELDQPLRAKIETLVK